MVWLKVCIPSVFYTINCMSINITFPSNKQTNKPNQVICILSAVRTGFPSYRRNSLREDKVIIHICVDNFLKDDDKKFLKWY